MEYRRADCGGCPGFGGNDSFLGESSEQDFLRTAALSSAGTLFRYVLFDYDCRHDTIRFTSNASKLLKIRELTQNHFLNGLDRAFIYAGDQEEVQRVLSGQTGGEYGEIRVRVMRPDTEEYFWCLVQYQNLYKSSAIDSIIGKITDIDERMPHE